MELTREQAIEEHRKMWNWIADNIEKIKPNGNKDIKEYYLYKIRKLDESIDNYCFCCEYSSIYETSMIKLVCDHCPIEWDGECRNCLSSLLYNNFTMAICNNKYDIASTMAKQIANLPEKKKPKNI